MRLTAGGQINDYTITEDERNDEAGKSVYAFAERDGRRFFIKKFIHIRYPENVELLGNELATKRLHECQSFEEGQRRVSDLLGSAAANYGIVSTEDFFREGPDYYRVTRRVEVVSDKLPLSTQGTVGGVHLLQGVASALGYFHSMGLVHGDVKLENFLVEDINGLPRGALIDFDDCYPVDAPPPAAVLGGTPSHFAPEVVAYIRSGGASPAPGTAADVFSAGLVMHEIVSGRLPRFPTRDQMVALSLLRGVPIDLSLVADRLAAVLRDLLEAEPGNRPTMAEVYSMLAGLDDHDLLGREIERLPRDLSQNVAPTEEEILDPKLTINMRKRVG